jgi:tRNA dimethylallyltransferase
VTEEPKERPPLALVIAGPTASGKSSLGLAIAQEFHGEIVNCDSVQVYRGLDIGTAKVPPSERHGIPHYLFDILDPDAVLSAGEYASLARPVVREIASRGRLPIISGGTGFYLKALLDGLPKAPGRNEALRKRLGSIEAHKAGRLHRLLRRVDPEAASRIHANDRNKLIRAVELRILTRRPAWSLLSEGTEALSGVRVVRIGLDPPRAVLHERIRLRTQAMFDGGLVEELRGLLARGFSIDSKAFESIGYKQAGEVISGRLSVAEALSLTEIATRQYAKRQLTWFRRQHKFIWINDLGESEAARQAVRDAIAHAFS